MRVVPLRCRSVLVWAVTATALSLMPSHLLGWCQQQNLGACPWGFGPTWWADCDCDTHGTNWQGNPCGEEGPPYLYCWVRDCSRFVWTSFPCARPQGQARMECLPADTVSFDCPCSEWWQCLIIE